jgi:hypothetical protein
MFSAAAGGFGYYASTSNTDPYWSSVSILLRTNSSGSANNRIVTDTGANSFTLSPGTLSRFSYEAPFSGVWGSVYNPSVSGAGVRSATSSLLTFAGDFTIEGWAKVPNGVTMHAYAEWISSNSGQNNGIFGRNASATPPRWASQGYGSPTWTAITDTSKSSNDGVWRYVALVRNGLGTNCLSFYVDGVLIGQRTVTASINYSAGNFGCGVGTVSPGAGDNQFYGYIAGVRISNIARYTSAFTPPTSFFTSDSNTMLLMQGNNAAYLDISNNKFGTMQNSTNVNQTASVQKFSGLNSISYIATTGYLQITPATITCAGDFTWECFVYVTSATSQNATSTVFNSTSLSVYTNISGYANVFSANVAGTVLNSGINSKDSNWHHVAVVRNGSGSNNITLYIDGTSTSTMTDTSSLTLSTPFIGGTATSSTNIIGNLSELRLTNGVARYTSNFTPPTQPFPTS